MTLDISFGLIDSSKEMEIERYEKRKEANAGNEQGGVILRMLDARG